MQENIEFPVFFCGVLNLCRNGHGHGHGPCSERTKAHKTAMIYKPTTQKDSVMVVTYRHTNWPWPWRFDHMSYMPNFSYISDHFLLGSVHASTRYNQVITPSTSLHKQTLYVKTKKKSVLVCLKILAMINCMALFCKVSLRFIWL